MLDVENLSQYTSSGHVSSNLAREPKHQALLEECVKPFLKQEPYFKSLVLFVIKRHTQVSRRRHIHKASVTLELHWFTSQRAWLPVACATAILTSMGDEKPSWDGNGDSITPEGYRKILCSAFKIKIMGLHMTPTSYGQSLKSEEQEIREAREPLESSGSPSGQHRPDSSRISSTDQTRCTRATPFGSVIYCTYL